MESLLGRFGETAQLPPVLLVAEGADEPISRRLRVDLRRRGFVVRAGQPRVLQTTDFRRSSEATASIVLVTFDSSNAKEGDKSLAHIEEVSRDGQASIVIANADDRRVESLVHQPETLIRYGAGVDYDRIFEELLIALLGPFPPWLDMRVSATQLAAPTGVSWWADDLVVADEHFGHIVFLSAGEAHPIVVGLHEPHHVHLDRHKLLIADKGSHRVVLGDLESGAVGNIRSVVGDRRGLICPNGVHQAEGYTAIADTDHHRILMTKDDLWSPKTRRRAFWQELEAKGGFRHPCGVFIGRNAVWVADTFHHRVVAFDHDGAELRELTGYGWEPGRFAYPTSVVGWHDLLLIADAEARRIQAFQVEMSGPHLIPLAGKGLGEGELGRPWVANPFGLSVNHNGRLAVADRLRRCVWLIDLTVLRSAWIAR